MMTSNVNRRAAARALAVCALAIAVPAGRADAQRKKPGREFTRQGLLITHFVPVDGADMRLGRRAADAVRSRAAKLVEKRDVDVIPASVIELELEQGGFPVDSLVHPALVASLGRQVRADEYLVAHAPDLSLTAVVGVLGERANGLDGLWDSWGRLRPLLMTTEEMAALE